MNISIASHYGMCFGVRDALRDTHALAADQKITVLGELVHNPIVQDHLATLGVKSGSLDTPSSTTGVVITAHGAADSVKARWSAAGHDVFDTTCPLVKKAHRSLECLVLAGFSPIVIGENDHVEVRGLVTDFPQAAVVMSGADIAALPADLGKIGIISQTTQPIDRVEALVHKVERRFPEAETRFVDTVCQPTKQRQSALDQLCRENDTIVVVGGNNSNNTRQLAEKARALGCAAFQVERPEDLDHRWFRRSENVGVTAGTSTLDETVDAVVRELKGIAQRKSSLAVFDALKAMA